jgi:hypothetical protein
MWQQWQRRPASATMRVELGAQTGVGFAGENDPLAVGAEFTFAQAGFQVASTALFGDGVQMRYQSAFHIQGGLLP